MFSAFSRGPYRRNGDVESILRAPVNPPAFRPIHGVVEALLGPTLNDAHPRLGIPKTMCGKAPLRIFAPAVVQRKLLLDKPLSAEFVFRAVPGAI
jgi:hypothetical protein